MLEVFSSESADLLIGFAVDKQAAAITLIWGDLRQHVLPFRFFSDFPSAVRPDFDDIEIVDCGQTLRFGKHEASADSILYEVCADYRRRTNAARVENDPSIGACIRRLRKQRGLSRQDFEPDISAKTLARIENGSDSDPRPKTMTIIAEKLGVPVGSLSTY